MLVLALAADARRHRHRRQPVDRSCCCVNGIVVFEYVFGFYVCADMNCRGRSACFGWVYCTVMFAALFNAFCVITAFNRLQHKMGSLTCAIHHALVTWLPRQECDALFWDRCKYSLATASIQTCVACSQAGQMIVDKRLAAPCNIIHTTAPFNDCACRSSCGTQLNATLGA